MSASRLTTLVLLAATLSGCLASSPAPKAWQRSLDDVQTQAYGAWTRAEGPSMAADGELLAVEPDRVYLARGDQVTVVPLICIEKLKVGAFETTAEPLAWGTVGALTTLSHGYFLVFSLPTWLLSTAPASRVHSSAGHIEEPRPGEAAPKLENLRKWARFPQGMPAGYLEQAREIRERRGSCEIFGPRPKPAAPTPEASRPAPAAPGLAPWQPEAPSGGAR